MYQKYFYEITKFTKNRAKKFIINVTQAGEMGYQV